MIYLGYETFQRSPAAPALSLLAERKFKYSIIAATAVLNTKEFTLSVTFFTVLAVKPTELETDASEEVRSSCFCRRRQLWAVLLKKVWDIDALKCPKCGGQYRLVENTRIRLQRECVPSYRVPGAYLSATMFDRGFPGFPGNHDLRDMLVSQAV